MTLHRSIHPIRLLVLCALMLVGVTPAFAAPTQTVVVTGNLSSTNDFYRNVPNPPTYTALDAVMDERADFLITDPIGHTHQARIYILRQHYEIFQTVVYVDGGDTGGTAGTPVQIYDVILSHDESGGVRNPLPFGVSDPIPWSVAGGQVIRFDLSHLAVPTGAPAAIVADPISGGNYTNQMTLTGNLNADSPISTGIDATTFAALQQSAQFTTSVEISDSLSARHTVQLCFFHTGTNAWTARGYLDGGELAGQAAGQPVQLFTQPLAYAVSGATVPVAPAVTTGALHWANGARGDAIVILFNPVTQFYSRSRMLSFVTPELAPLPTPTPTPSTGDCAALRACLSTSIDAAMNSCQQTANACAQSSDSLVITPEALAQRAIDGAHCAGRTKSACRRCYQHAAKLAARGKDAELFHGLLAQAIALIQAAGQTACR